MKEIKLSTKKPIAALAIWFAIVFIFTALFTSISLLVFQRDKTDIYSDTAIEYVGKKLADERFAEPIAEVNAENDEVAAKVTSAASIATAFESDFNTYLVKTDSTITNVNPLNSDDDVSGSGTQDDPYLVKTLRGWLWIENLIQYTPVQYRYITLAADIDFDGYILDIVAMQTNCFVGIFDGAGFTFKNVITKCSLFGGVGASFGESGVTVYEQYNSEIKNLNAKVISVSGGGEMPNAFLAGATAYNTKINNCQIDQFSYDDKYAMTTAVYLLGGVEISDCYFNIRTKNGLCCVAGYAISNANVGIATTNQSSLIDSCIIDVNIHTSVNSAGTIVVGTAFGAPITVSNCKAYGNYTSTGRWGDGTYMGVYMNFLSFPNGADAYIKNCENYVNCAMYGPIGNLVGSVLANDKDTAESPNGKLYVQNCTNYGDAYNTYDGSGSSSRFDSMSLSGFIGEIEGDTTTTLEGCKNYGSQYGGSFMAGFVSNCQSRLVVKNCDNYGSINYTFGAFVGGSIAGVAVVSMDKCYNMTERSVLIDNCSFVGKVVNKPYTTGCFDHDTDGYENWYFGGICSTGRSDFTTTDAVIKEVIIQNCFINVEIAGKRTVYSSPIYLGALTFNYTENSIVLIDQNMAVVTFRGEPVSSGGYFVFDKVTAETGSANEKCPANFTSSNNYYEVNAVNTSISIGHNGTGGEGDAIGYYSSGNLNFWNNQISINIKFTQEYFDEFISSNTTLESEVVQTDMFDYQKGDAANISIRDVSYSINLDIQTTSQISGLEGFVNKIFKKYNLNDYSNNVVLTYNSNVEGDTAEKYYYHSDETVEKFGADKWFYCPELNGGRPMLRQFFHLAKYYTGQDCFARLEELGYTKYVPSTSTT